MTDFNWDFKLTFPGFPQVSLLCNVVVVAYQYTVCAKVHTAEPKGRNASLASTSQQH